jgi:hypothetical protein
MSWKLVSTACCTEDIQIVNESFGWSPGLEA